MYFGVSYISVSAEMTLMVIVIVIESNSKSRCVYHFIFVSIRDTSITVILEAFLMNMYPG